MRTVADFRREIAECITRTQEGGAIQECPLCGQGALIETEVRATGEQILFCEECDCIWPCGCSIDGAHAEAHETFVDANGKRGLTWMEIKIA